MDSTFIYPITIHRGGAVGSLTANWVAALPASMNTTDERVAVLYSSEGKFPQGLYLNESNSSVWRYIIPYSAICLGIIEGAAINVYYAVTNPNSGLPSTAKIWRNGTETDNPIFTVNDGAVYGAMTIAVGDGQVTSVNGALPDGTGNVTVPIATNTVAGTVKGGGNVTISADGTLNAPAAPVTSVSGQVGAVVIEATNNNSASGTTLISDSGATTGNIKLKTLVAGTNIAVVDDTNGNLQVNNTYSLPAASTLVLGGVKQGSNVTIAGDGTISVAAPYALPAATTSTLGGVIVGSGLAVALDGTISANVLSVNGHQGAVVLSASDITTGTFSAGVIGATAGNNDVLITNASGVPTWVSTIPTANLPASILGAVDYQGTFIPGTTTLPAAAVANKGWYFVANAAGTYTPPSGTLLTFAAGDWLISNGTSWSTVSTQGAVTSVNGQTGAVTVKAVDNNNATGTTLISDGGATTGTLKLKTLVAGTNISLAADANGNLVVNNTAVQTGLTEVTSVGTGNSLVNNTGLSGGNAMIKSLAAGSNITITPDGGNQTLTITANQVITPATTSSIGGVIVKAGLAVDGSGNLTLAAPTGVNLGGVKAGTGISIAADGTISSTAVGGVSSVSGQTGAVVVQATDTSTASGTSLITDSGATTANVKIRRLVAGTGITLAADGNNNLQINSTATGGVSSMVWGTSGALTGAITVTAGQSISISNTGNTVQINGTGVPEAPNDGNLYARQNQAWAAIPATSNPIVAVNGQTGTGAVLLVEASPPANTAVIKSLVAGANITLSETGGLITVTAAIPGGTVATVNSKAPDGSGNVTLAASDVSALPTAGGTMSGDINMATHKVTGLPTPTVASDAVPLSFINGMVIDGGVIG